MSIVVRFHPSNATREKYDESLRRMEEAGIWPNPPGLEVHVAFGPDDDLRASEIWSSREEFEAYGEKLMPILSDIGVESNLTSSRFRISSSHRRQLPAGGGLFVLAGCWEGSAGLGSEDHQVLWAELGM